MVRRGHPPYLEKTPTDIYIRQPASLLIPQSQHGQHLPKTLSDLSEITTGKARRIQSSRPTCRTPPPPQAHHVSARPKPTPSPTLRSAVSIPTATHQRPSPNLTKRALGASDSADKQLKKKRSSTWPSVRSPGARLSAMPSAPAHTHFRATDNAELQIASGPYWKTRKNSPTPPPPTKNPNPPPNTPTKKQPPTTHRPPPTTNPHNHKPTTHKPPPKPNPTPQQPPAQHPHPHSHTTTPPQDPTPPPRSAPTPTHRPRHHPQNNFFFCVWCGVFFLLFCVFFCWAIHHHATHAPPLASGRPYPNAHPPPPPAPQPLALHTPRPTPRPLPTSHAPPPQTTALPRDPHTESLTTCSTTTHLLSPPVPPLAVSTPPHLPPAHTPTHPPPLNKNPQPPALSPPTHTPPNPTTHTPPNVPCCRSPALRNSLLHAPSPFPHHHPSHFNP